jgi:hypothetical protein
VVFIDVMKFTILEIAENVELLSGNLSIAIAEKRLSIRPSYVVLQRLFVAKFAIRNCPAATET